MHTRQKTTRFFLTTGVANTQLRIKHVSASWLCPTLLLYCYSAENLKKKELRQLGALWCKLWILRRELSGQKCRCSSTVVTTTRCDLKLCNNHSQTSTWQIKKGMLQYSGHKVWWCTDCVIPCHFPCSLLDKIT